MQSDPALQEAEESTFKPLTAEQAQQWRARNPSLSLWVVVVVQVFVGAAVSLGLLVFTSHRALVLSAMYGAVSVVLPAAVFAYGMRRRPKAASAGVAMMRFWVWEFAKLALTVVILLMAPRWVHEVNWLVLVGSFVLTLKAAWWVMWIPRLRATSSFE